ncbi:ABC-2 transporter permease [Paenibacillus pini]|uniref:Uncharacterized protein n=1 Tax=Paenibacillus pini JCM 16418 TaxID=1236976 RepID=W7YLL2_9BACL|nr:ABC-2 transporter permease [Paenibacillus pini]GAF09477.1 hypothetical protein JCM16418_3619 [Paenibacillus pini JCM 16418]
MNATRSTFWALTLHEFKNKGSWRKKNRTKMSRAWWLAYCLLLVIAALGATTYFAVRETFPLDRIWLATLGFPYIVFFLGFGSIKREWENETYGWWLTLPYSRLHLIGAKWLGTWIKVLIVISAVFVIGTVYIFLLSLILSNYTLSDAASFIITGLNWLSIMIGFSPILISLGLIMNSVMHSTLRPLTPVLWIVFMSSFSILFYNNDNFLSEGSLDLSNGSQPHMAVLFPYHWAVPLSMLISWLVTYFVIRLTAYLFQEKLSL